MPELPEVQTIVNDLLAAGLLGKRLQRVEVLWPRLIAQPDPDSFCRLLQGRRIETLERRGKLLHARLSSDRHLLMHLKMSGRLRLTPPSEPRTAYDHVVMSLGRWGELRFHDSRKFGRLYLLQDPNPILGRLGPEPLDPAFTAREMARRLGQSRRRIKPLLLDQRMVAGMGNIYTDEALWEAGIHPCRRASTLSEAEIRSLHRAMRRVLRRAVAHAGTSLGDGRANFRSIDGRAGRNQQSLRVYRRTAEPCPRCRTPIERIVLGQRGTHLCPGCQS